ncbi:Co2+/Mg2+ efflux protein ApaG [Paucibacter sp. APW11]|uniref:Co2+/Mg2+ efflux protein ApaG n=1 Tax=Roseateles aquae TaxID=3077235 RepID=A0ABU3PBL9_9BURK|nr:Co2+/Mg2+ efflux protein ApaG [Paucibacter sp. APW11]MDT8999961.1 Co2+/Mg2+ efflux protein ApaG [Paucibacter sp. APW11]
MAHPQFRCTVQVQALEEQTDAATGVYAYSYTITIENSGDIAAQLVAREWQISDAKGHVQQVRGLAVVGHQPLLQPGEKFQYSSWAQIESKQGSMKGRYLCVTEAAEVFYADVPEFLLADSASLH